jgi:hypothetical protein
MLVALNPSAQGMPSAVDLKRGNRLIVERIGTPPIRKRARSDVKFFRNFPIRNNFVSRFRLWIEGKFLD